MANRISSSGPLAGTGVLWSGKVGESVGLTLNVLDNGGGSSITIEQSSDNSSWSAVTALPYLIASSGITPQTSAIITNRGVYFVPTVGLTYIRFRVTTYVSGLVSISVDDTTSTEIPPYNNGYYASDFGIVADGVTLDAPAINTAMALISVAGGGTLSLPAGRTVNIGSTRLDMASNVILAGFNTTILCTGQAFRSNANAGAGLQGLTFKILSGSGQPLVQNCSRFVIDNCVFDGLAAGIAFTNGSNKCRVVNSEFKNGAGIQLTSVTECVVSGNVINTTIGFGIWVNGTTNGCLIEGNKSTSTNIELIGATYLTYNNRYIGNHAEGSGDNGISITGYNNTVVGNICKNNAFFGICIFGSNNTVQGNVCINNNQALVAGYAGIGVLPASGGMGQYNTISGNFVDDDQAVKTQDYAIRVYALSASYTQWTTGQAVTVGTYRYNGLNLYVAASAGTCGATAPVHTSGTVSDGAVTWTYIGTWGGTAPESYGNVLADNVLRRAKTALTIDNTTKFGNIWDGAYQGNGSPEGIVTANVGAFYRNTAGGVSTTLYVKTSGTGSTGWTAK